MKNVLLSFSYPIHQCPENLGGAQVHAHCHFTGTYDKPGNPWIILSLNFQTTQADGHYFSYFRNMDTQVQK